MSSTVNNTGGGGSGVESSTDNVADPDYEQSDYEEAAEELDIRRSQQRLRTLED